MTDVHLSHKWRSVQETPKHWPPRTRASPFPTTLHLTTVSTGATRLSELEP